MSLPPGFLDELRTRTSLTQVVGRKVMWDNRKSNQGKGDMWAPCPFHQEKSASFHVDDRQGFYYCFGCHAKGDAISFVRETENVGFMEAIEILAREAGMTMPARDPQAQQRSDRRGELAEVMEQAVQFYRLQLKTAGAAAARDYLSRRGLADATQARFEIGFAPDSRTGLSQAMLVKGVPPKMLLDAGLTAEPDGGGAPYDRFRGRIIFPIRDGRGRCIGLGGRAMDPNARAKYLNSPETELFDKGRSLYNHAPAREAAGKGQPLIVAEGYMDVIALVEGGFGATVAPLGTAITEDQLRLLWRIHPEPIIALDGDTAGLRAAMRVIDLAMPMLEAGQSLRFCMLPEGLDPDDLIRRQGREAMQKLLDQALPMVRLLWQRETEGKVFDSPERKAALDKDLRNALRQIKDPSIRSHYGEEIKELRLELFGRGRAAPSFTRGRWTGPRKQVLPTTKSSALASASLDGTEERLREALILAVVLNHPELLADFSSELERIDLIGPGHSDLRAAVLRYGNAPGDLKAKVEQEIGANALETLFGQSHLKIVPAVRPGADADMARLCLAEELAKLTAKRGMARELSEALEDIGSLVDEGLTWRLTQAVEAKNRAERAENEDRTEYDTGDNGARISRDERSALDDLLSQIAGSQARKH